MGNEHRMLLGCSAVDVRASSGDARASIPWALVLIQHAGGQRTFLQGGKLLVWRFVAYSAEAARFLGAQGGGTLEGGWGPPRPLPMTWVSSGRGCKEPEHALCCQRGPGSGSLHCQCDVESFD